MIEKIEQLVAKAVGFDRADTQSEVAWQRQNARHQIFKIQTFCIVPPDIDAGEHDFFIAKFHHAADVVVDFLRLAADGPTPHTRYNAKCAEVVAAILNFYPAACMESFACRLIIEKRRVEAVGMHHLALIMAVDKLEDGAFVFVIHKPGNVGLLLFEVLAVVVHHAARHHQHGIGVFFGCLVDHLARLAVALVGNGAGVDHHHVGGIFKIDHLIAAAAKARSQRIGLKLIESATQGFESYFFHLIKIEFGFDTSVSFHELIITFYLFGLKPNKFFCLSTQPKGQG